MPLQTRIIHIHPLAPDKPAAGLPCNGCGVCCLVEPCPLGMVLSRKRRGACVALRWNDAQGVYRCGAVTSPKEVVASALPSYLRWLAPACAAVLAALARRWIAAGAGCDSSIELQKPSINDNAADASIFPP